jgi:hypothetical protein
MFYLIKKIFISSQADFFHKLEQNVLVESFNLQP